MNHNDQPLRNRLTYNKVAKAINAVVALTQCRDLPDEDSGPFGNVRANLERALVDDLNPLLQLVDDTQ